MSSVPLLAPPFLCMLVVAPAPMAIGTVDPSCPQSTLCTGISTLRLVRNKDWTCDPVTTDPHLQTPPLCDEHNRFVPNVFVVSNESYGRSGHDVYRLVLTPSFSYDDNGVLKYEFRLGGDPVCAVGGLSVSIKVINKQVRTSVNVVAEFFAGVLLVLLVFLCFLLAAASPPSSRTSGNASFATGYVVARSSLGRGSATSRARFE